MRIQAGNADVLAKVNDQVKNELHIYSAIAGQNCHLHLWHFGVNHVLVFTQRLSWHTHTHTHTHAGMPNHSPSATLWGQLCTGIYTTPVVTHTHTGRPNHSPSATCLGQSCTGIYTTPIVTHTHTQTHTHTHREAKSLTICDLFGSIMYWLLHNACRDTHTHAQTDAHTHTHKHTHTPGGQITHHLRHFGVNHVLVIVDNHIGKCHHVARQEVGAPPFLATKCAQVCNTRQIPRASQ